MAEFFKNTSTIGWSVHPVDCQKFIFGFKEAPMAKHNSKAVAKSVNVAETAKESAMLRTLRIDGSQNGATLRTRVVRDKTKYSRNVKHRKSFADAGDFPFYAVFNPLPNRIVVRNFYF